MRITKCNLLWLSLSLALGCGANDGASGSSANALAVSDESGDDGDDASDEDGDDVTDEDGDDASDEDGDDVTDEDGDDDDLDCPRGGETGPIRVVFDCDEIEVTTCKDLSNVVLELEDGSRQRYEGLSGHDNTFAGSGEHEGKVVVGVWVKSGANHSGDGPGYGERFDAPEDSCEPSDTEPPSSEEPPADQLDPVLL